MLHFIRLGSLLVILAFVACGDTDDTESTNAMKHWVGIWKWNSGLWDMNGRQFVMFAQYKPDGTYSHRSSSELEFFPLGTYSVTDDTFEFISEVAAYEARGLWTMPDMNTVITPKN